MARLKPDFPVFRQCSPVRRRCLVIHPETNNILKPILSETDIVNVFAAAAAQLIGWLVAVLQGVRPTQYALIIESAMLINCEFTHKLKAVTWMI
ncbi:hypothetical protein QUF31_02085 [Dickeya chrysanthemi]|uniref:hypothetical protein n=1 Tax=Dickeya chrysanthemi TaxID=556 RepID=UPI0025A28079|nr:hypothetical protein [Dickeya chrysanthemi]WJM85942.1 hypothetical protein QUF31_02085 [Dickeya chrysanthemi]